MEKDWNTFDPGQSAFTPEKKNVLIMGGAGFIGRHLARAFIESGWKVTSLQRSGNHPVISPSLKVVHADRGDLSNLFDPENPQFYDCSVDLIGKDRRSAELITESLFGRTAHHIHLSSQDVYRVIKGISKPWREDDCSGELKSEPENIPGWFVNGVRNRNAEDILWDVHRAKGFPLTVVRPSHVSGQGDPTATDYTHMLRLREKRPIVIPANSGFFRTIQVSDLVKIIHKIALKPSNAIGKSYNAAGASILNLTEYIEIIALILDLPFEPVLINQDVTGSMPEYPLYSPDSLIPDITLVEKDLNFTPRGTERFIGGILEWYRDDYKGDVPAVFISLSEWERHIIEG